jgi:hypothetical protein
MYPTKILLPIEREQEIKRISVMTTDQLYFFRQDIEMMQTDIKREYRELYNIATGVVSVDSKDETDICFSRDTIAQNRQAYNVINVDVHLIIKSLLCVGIIGITLAAFYGMCVAVVAWMFLYGIYAFGVLVCVWALYLFLFGGGGSDNVSVKKGEIHNHYYYQNNSFGGGQNNNQQ